MTTFENARNEIFTLIYNAWLPTGFLMLWPDKPGTVPTARTPWARTTLRHSAGFQATLSDPDGKARYERIGNVVVQVFTPCGEGLTRSYALCKILSDAIEGNATPSSVWFRNLYITEIGGDTEWNQVNLYVDFTYQELK